MEKSWAHLNKQNIANITKNFVFVLSLVGIIGCSAHKGSSAMNRYPAQAQRLEKEQIVNQDSASNSQRTGLASVSEQVSNSPKQIYSTPTAPLSPTSSNTATRIYSEAPAPPTAPEPANRGGVLVAHDQGVSEADRALILRIRQNMMSDSSLAVVAPNVKVLVNNGKVTLQGSVKTQEEKQNLETSVQKTSGVASVDDQIEVKSGPP
ncbi:MAG: Transport-associated protein [Pedosphaera sp.]|nr:Transport-associated protein [Pedosphaera sp.]